MNTDNKRQQARPKHFALSAFMTLTLALCGAFPSGSASAHASSADAEGRFAPGASLLAADQADAGKGVDVAGLDIAWLDLDGYILASYGSGMGADGVFVLDLMQKEDGTGFRLAFDMEGKVLFEPKYNTISNFSEGFASVVKYTGPASGGEGRVPTPPPSISGIVDKSGRELFPLGTWLYPGDFHDGMASVIKFTDDANGWYPIGFVDKTGANVIPPRYGDVGDFSEGLAAAYDATSNKWGYIDKTGATVIPFQYDTAARFSEGLAYVSSGTEAGYIDPQNKMVVKLPGIPNSERPYYDLSFYGGLAASWDPVSQKWGYIGKDGRFAIAPEYAEVEPFVEDAAWVQYADPAYPMQPSFLIDRNGEVQTPAWMYSHFMDNAYRENDGIFPVQSSNISGSDFASDNGLYGALNSHGAEIVPLRFSYMSNFTKGRALVIANVSDRLAAGILKAPEGYADMRGGQLIRATVDGKQIRFTDIPPVIENGRTLVPLRAVFEALGAKVSWDEATKTVTAEKDGALIKLKIGDDTAEANGKTVKLEAPARIDRGRTLVPIRFVAESLGAEVQWEATSRTVVVATASSGGR